MRGVGSQNSEDSMIAGTKPEHFLAEGEQRKHAAGFTALGAVGEIVFEMTGGTAAFVVDGADAGGAELIFDGRPEVEVVVAGADAGADEGEDVGRARWHRGDGGSDDVGECAFFAGVDESDGLRCDEKNRGAVGVADEEREAGGGGNEGVNGEVGAGFGDEGDAVAVGLFGAGEVFVAEGADEILFVVAGFGVGGGALGEGVEDVRLRSERREGLEGRRHGVDLTVRPVTRSRLAMATL